jgi:F-type H+-transporting ATPase subunit epsilon
VPTMLNLEIITPKGSFYVGEVHLVTMPGIDGEFGIMLGHASTIFGLGSGLISIYDDKLNILKQIFIDTGFVEVTGDSATALVKEAKYLEHYDLKETMKRLDDLTVDLDFCKEEASKDLIYKEIMLVENLLQILKRQ